MHHLHPKLENLVVVLQSEVFREIRIATRGVHDERAVETLLKALREDTYHEVREAAAEALGMIEDKL